VGDENNYVFLYKLLNIDELKLFARAFRHRHGICLHDSVSHKFSLQEYFFIAIIRYILANKYGMMYNFERKSIFIGKVIDCFSDIVS